MPGMMFEGANGGRAGDLFELTTTDATTGATTYADITASIPNVDVTVNPYNGDSLDGRGRSSPRMAPTSIFKGSIYWRR